MVSFVVRVTSIWFPFILLSRERGLTRENSAFRRVLAEIRASMLHLA